MTTSAHIDIPYIAQQLGKGKEKKTPRGYSTLCPVHGDKDPTLDLENKSGKITLWCHFCKDNAPIIEYLKVNLLWPAGGVIGNEVWRPMGRGASSAMPREEWWASQGMAPVAFYDYVDTDGTFLFQVVRFIKDGKKTFLQYYQQKSGKWSCYKVAQNVKYVPYNLPGIERARKNGDPVCLHEGEKDAELCTADGIESSTCPKGGGNWQDSYTPYFKDVKTFMVPDNDFIGYKHLNEVGQSFKKYGQDLWWVELPGWSHKDDYSDWRQNFDAEMFKDLLQSEAKLWTEPVPNPWPDPKKAKVVENENGPTTPNNVVVLPLGDLELFTDSGNSNRFHRMYSDIASFSKERGWFLWDGQRHCASADLEVRELAKEVARSIQQESEGNHGDRLKWAKESFGRGRLNAILSVAESMDGIKVDTELFDKDPYLINTKSGVVDLNTGVIHKHDQKFMCTRMTACGVDKDREPEMFMVFLGSITNGCPHRIEFLQRLGGYLLTGKTSLQQAYFIHGPGLNGKSIFIDTMAMMMGIGASGYAASPEAAMFLKNQVQSQKYDFSQLLGKRLAAVGEVEANARLDENKLKTFTGDSDLLSARFLFREPFEFQNTAKVLFRCNYLPVIVNRDNGIWRRILKVPFDVTIPKPSVIRNLFDLLKDEWDAIMWWRIQGAMKVLRDINAGNPLLTPDEFGVMTDEYKDEMDSTGMFLNECYELYANSEESKLYSTPIQDASEALQNEWFVSNRELSRVYKRFCDDFTVSTRGPRRFKIDLIEKGLVQVERGWLGLKLRKELAN